MRKFVPSITKAEYWNHCKSKGNYLFPAKVMSSLFRGKFMDMLRAFCRSRKIPLGNDWCSDLYRTQWVVYAKPVFAGHQQVIEYLGRYTHRIAISNHRLLTTDQGHVSFTYKDYRQAGIRKTMTLQASEFLFLSAHFAARLHEDTSLRNTGQQGKAATQGAAAKNGCRCPARHRLDWKEIARTVLHFDPDACPICKVGRMKILAVLDPEGRSPQWPAALPCPSLTNT